MGKMDGRNACKRDRDYFAISPENKPGKKII
jgi:hypothetical protein